MKKIVLLYTVLFLTSFAAFAQNEWIDYSKTYYKLLTNTDGIYRISYTTLSASGLTMSSLDPRTIRVYHRGVEVAVFVSGQEDGRFDQQDYIEVIGERNDGDADRELYEQADQMANPEYNLHTDATAFFITVTPGQYGKRVAQRALDPSLAPLTYIRQEVLQVFGEQYSLGRSYTLGMHLGSYDVGEGWTSAVITRGKAREIVFSDLAPFLPDLKAAVSVAIVGRSEAPHLVDIFVGANESSLRLVETLAFEGFAYLSREYPLRAEDFGADGKFLIRISPKSMEGNNDNVSVSYAKLTYNRQLISSDFSKEIVMIPAGQYTLDWSALSEAYRVYDISDISQPILLAPASTSSGIQVSAGNPLSSTRLLMMRASSRIETTTLERITFQNLLGSAANYLIMTHPDMRKPTSVNVDPVAAYASYRQSPAGGGFQTLIFTAEDLYNQFNYGEKSPLAIKKFLKQYYERYHPEYLLLMGRAFGMYNTERSGSETYYYRDRPDLFTQKDYVPTFGYPYNDNRFVVGFDPSIPNDAAMAVGRIPSTAPEQINDYLNKVKEKEALGASANWQKDLIHLSGGLSAFELERYYVYLQGFERIAEGPFLGGDVTTFRKRNNTATELINISGKVNEGTSLVTFFGHAATSTTDIDVGFVSQDELGYANKGKYPALLMNGCDAGNAFGKAYTFGEDWIITPDRGATNFMANASIGVDVFLRRYSETFYEKAFQDSSLIYQSIGKVKLASEVLFYERYGNSSINQSHANQMIMLGDPAVGIFPAPHADYSLNKDEVSLQDLNGNKVNNLTDTLDLTFVVRNLGRVDMDTVEITVSRQLPDGTLINFEPKKIAPIYYRDTIHYSVPNIGVVSAGDNVFTIAINSKRTVPEISFANNSIMASLFIESSGTQNLSPLPYAIHSREVVEMVAQIPGKSTEERTIIFQLDTSPDFSSSWRKEARVTTLNLARFSQNIADRLSGTDTVTFYWRTKFLQAKEGESQDWATDSFSFIPNGPEGWIQRQFAQLEENQLVNLQPKGAPLQWQYEGTKLDVDIFTFGDQTEGLSYGQVQIQLDGISYNQDLFQRRCTDGSFALMAFDQRSLASYLVVPLTNFDVLDGKSCGKTPQIIQNIRNSWITDPEESIFYDYIDGVKDGDYVVLFSVGAVTFDDWPDAAYQKMKELGANEARLRNLATGDPYILFGRKGMKAGDATEIVADPSSELPASQQVITFNTTLEGYFDQGYIASGRIGPSAFWDRFYNQTKAPQPTEEEEFAFDVIGVRADGQEELLFREVLMEELSLTDINAERYPFLRLQFSLDQSENRIPRQLSQWQVNYTGVPEGVLILKNKENEIRLEEGEDTLVKFEFINISNVDFSDSLKLQYSFLNKITNTVEDFQQMIPAVKAGESYTFEIPFSSLGNPGSNSLNITVNPREYMEQTFKNNVLDLADYIIVKEDDQNPVLDVSFDGVYIMDGDIVSPSVMILALVKDENQSLLKQDTTGVEVFLKRDCESCTFERVSFSGPSLKWSSATATTDFKLEYQPGPLEDGVYTLRVNAEDGSGNQAGDKPYEVQFEVINESSISHFYPYPNPFSTSVRFVFTVTGIAPPDEVKIQIMTVTGKVVKEILQDELGPLKIGNNISEYAWDGKDEFGDQLANGVYIYRVLVRKDGQFIEHRATAGDKAFKKGYGKMYLLR